jgi:hypothetical protein
VNPRSYRTVILILSITLIGLFSDSILANKFQTIGSGVSGSSQIKIEYLRISAYVISGLFFMFGLLAMTTKKRNAHHLNYTAWKTSSIAFLLLGLITLVIGLLI